MSGKTDTVAVIGAGLGGLAAAIDLAVAGLPVTVVEAAAGPGGKMRTLPSPAGPVDAGPTVLTLRPVFEALFARAGAVLSDHVTLHRETVLARHWWPDGATLDLHADPEASAAAVRSAFGPRAERDFRAFSTEAAGLFAAFDAPMIRSPKPDPAALARAALARPAIWAALLPGMTLRRRLALRFRDPHLRQLFGRYATYVGGLPQASPAVLGLIWQAEAGGVWRVDGGMHRIAQALESLAVARGVRFVYNAPVARIEMQGGRAAGLQLADGRRIGAAHVVYAGDPAALHRGMLGKAAAPAVQASAVAPRSLSAAVWAFAARPSALPRAIALHHHNVFFGSDPAEEFGPLGAGLLPRDPTLYVCAQDRGAGAPAPEGAERFEIILNAPPLHEGTPRDIPEEEAACRTLVFPTLARYGLTFDPEPGPEALTRPAGFARLFPGSDGSLYGRSPHGLTASLQRPTARSAVPGLYLAGGGTHPGAGVPMATLSGRHAAAAILTDRALPSTSRRTAMPGGMSTGSRIAAPAPSRSSGS